MDTLGCINNTIWEAYANKTISQADLIYMTEHVKTCEICADVKEGIDTMPMPELLVDRVDKVNSRVDEIIKQKNSKKTLIYYWSAAAILFISFGLVWYNTLDINQEMALKESKKPAPKNEVEIPQKDSIYNHVPPALNENKTDKNLANNNINIEAETVEAPTPMKMENSMPDMGLAQLAEADESQMETKESIALTDSVVTTRNDGFKNIEKITDKALSLSDISVAKKSKKYSIPATANNNLMNNNLEYVSTQFPANFGLDSSNFTKAQNAFNTNQFDTCINLLNAIQINPRSSFYEDALYLSAQTYLKQNKKIEAKNVLNVLINLKGKKQKEAKRLLKTVK